MSYKRCKMAADEHPRRQDHQHRILTATPSGGMYRTDDPASEIPAMPAVPLRQLNWSRLDEDDADLVMGTVQLKEVEEVSAFLLDNFFAQEPLGAHLGLDPNKEVRPWLPKVLEHEIREGLSIVVRSKSSGGNSVLPFFFFLSQFHSHRMCCVECASNQREK